MQKLSAGLLTRMKIVRNRLKERGIDIDKIYVCWTDGDFTLAQRMEDKCTMFEAYLDGKYTTLKEFGDRPNV